MEKKKIRSDKTAKVYGNAIRLWASTRGFDDPDLAIAEIKGKGLDPYEVIQQLVNQMHQKRLAPKTILSYATAVKGFMVDSDIEVTAEKMKAKVVLPEAYTVTTDRAPTKDEVKRILLHCNLEAKAEVAMMASSGMRIGELPKLKVANIEFGQPGEPSKVRIKAKFTKTRKERITFISPEATELLKEHLGKRIDHPDETLFLENQDAIYGKIMRALKKSDLRKKSEEGDMHYELHPHCFRKYFHTNMLASGVDRGIVEGFEGHKFALDSSYLRATDEQLLEQYRKGLDAVTFLSNNAPLKSKVEETREELEKVKERIRRGDSRETLLEAVEEYEKKLMEKWSASNQEGAEMRMMFMPTELDQVRWVKAILTNPNSTALDVYKAQRRFDKIIEEGE